MKPIESRFFLTFFTDRSFIIVPTGNCTSVQDPVELTETPDEDISDSLNTALHFPKSNQERGDEALEKDSSQSVSSGVPISYVSGPCGSG